MGIQQCKNCGTKFNYMDLQKIFWSGYKPIICRRCRSSHVWKMSYRIIFAIMIVLPAILSMINPFGSISVLNYIFYVAVISGLYPFIVRYDLQDKRG